MKKTLSTYIEGRNNNFNLIRFVAAAMVLFSHSFILSSGLDDAEPFIAITGMTLSAVAVDVFFVISGFLITASMLRRKELSSFVWSRILRIYPALIVAVAFCVFVVGLFFTTNPKLSYLTNFETIRFFFKNASLFSGVTYNLPGVFEGLPYAKAVNGSLWTLPCEMLMYFVVALLGCRLFAFKGRGYPKYLLVCIFVVSLAAYGFKDVLLPGNYSVLGRLFVMFFMGSTYYIFRDKIVLSGKVFVVMLFLLVAAVVAQKFFLIFYIAFIAYMIFYLAYIPSGYIRKFNGLGDYSYGMYIYAFPVQQSVAASVKGVSVGALMGISFIITLSLSILSWHLIEKRALKFKRR